MGIVFVVVVVVVVVGSGAGEHIPRSSTS